MSEDQNENLLVTTYIKRHETILLEHIRKQIDAESRNTLLQMAMDEQSKLLDERDKTITALQNTVNQSLVSVQSSTVDREAMSSQIQNLQHMYDQRGNELQELRQKYEQQINELRELNHRYSVQQNSINEENKSLKDRLEATENNLNTIKNNYTLVVQSLEECQRAQQQHEPKKKLSKTTIKKDPEWIDGNEISD